MNLIQSITIGLLIIISLLCTTVTNAQFSQNYTGTSLGTNCGVQQGLGYWATLRDVNPAVTAFTPLSGMTSVMSTGTDDDTFRINIGFSFIFYNAVYTQLSIATNGNLQFVTSTSVYRPAAFPDVHIGMQPAILMYYTDLVLNAPIQYKTNGTIGNRILYIQYDTRYFASVTNVKLEILLFESTNSIVIRYITAPAYSNKAVSIGIVSSSRNADGSTPFIAIINARAPNVNELTGRELTFLYSTAAPSIRECPSSSSLTPGAIGGIAGGGGFGGLLFLYCCWRCCCRKKQVTTTIIQQQQQLPIAAIQQVPMAQYNSQPQAQVHAQAQAQPQPIYNQPQYNQPQYQPQPQYNSQPQYQPQPAYNSQPQYNQQQQPQYTNQYPQIQSQQLQPQPQYAYQPQMQPQQQPQMGYSPQVQGPYGTPIQQQPQQYTY